MLKAGFAVASVLDLDAQCHQIRVDDGSAYISKNK